MVEEATWKHAPPIIIWKTGHKPRWGWKKRRSSASRPTRLPLPAAPHKLGKTSDHSYRAGREVSRGRSSSSLCPGWWGQRGLSSSSLSGPREPYQKLADIPSSSLTGELLLNLGGPLGCHLYWGVSSELTASLLIAPIST